MYHKVLVRLKSQHFFLYFKATKTHSPLGLVGWCELWLRIDTRVPRRHYQTDKSSILVVTVLGEIVVFGII